MRTLVFLAVLTLVYSNGNVRIVDRAGSDNTDQGRVEVRLDGEWGQICGDNFGENDAKVVCNELGYEGRGSVETGLHGIGSDPIVIGHVGCTGDETSILDCSYRRMSNCLTSIAAVDCTATLGATGSVGLEAGIIAAIVICLVAIVGVVILFGACLWRNDVCCGGAATA